MSSETTFCYQKSLPKLPLPKLQDTLSRYLQSLRALLNDDDYAKAESIVQEFGKSGGIGEELHQYIEEKAKTADNWVSDWWTKYVYMMERKPLPISVTGCVSAGAVPVNNEEEYIDLAAKVAIAISDYYWQIYTETLPVEKVGGKPLCMIQKLNMFAGGRIPKHEIDDFDNQSLNVEPSKHLIISHNNTFFSVESIKDGKVISYPEMRMQVEKLIRDSQQTAEPIGILTAGDRDTWADAYAMLIKDAKNYESWHTIHHGLSVLSLERKLPQVPVGPDDPEYTNELLSIYMAEALHGCGSHYSSANRWNDKPIGYYLGSYGNYGMIGEHSNLDGASIAQFNVFVDQVVPKIKTDVSLSKEYLDSVVPPKKMDWNITSDMNKIVQQTELEFNKAVDNIDQRALLFDEYGKEFIKAQKVSPDSFFQVLLQLTYYLLHKKVGSQYESSTSRVYLHGRTDNIRSATVKTKYLCEIWDNPNLANKDKIATYMEAAKYHNKLVREAAVGQAWDRHLFGLKIVAREKDLPEPELFKDPSYGIANYYQVSTSQLSMGPISAALFAPAVSDGYGVSYNIQPNHFVISCSTFKDCDITDSTTFLHKIRNMLRQIHVMITSIQKDSSTST